MTQDEIRHHLGASERVHTHIAVAGDGSPEMAWGDTFFHATDEIGEPRKMPFVTIVIKDYTGFDSASKLDRGGLYRLNMDVGRETFQELFGFAPHEPEAHRGDFDFAALDRLFPHPAYGSHGWISIINPGDASADHVMRLLNEALARATR